MPIMIFLATITIVTFHQSWHGFPGPFLDTCILGSALRQAYPQNRGGCPCLARNNKEMTEDMTDAVEAWEFITDIFTVR